MFGSDSRRERDLPPATASDLPHRGDVCVPAPANEANVALRASANQPGLPGALLLTSPPRLENGGSRDSGFHRRPYLSSGSWLTITR